MEHHLIEFCIINNFHESFIFYASILGYVWQSVEAVSTPSGSNVEGTLFLFLTTTYCLASLKEHNYYVHYADILIPLF